jgi:periplasmic copper chaperone A
MMGAHETGYNRAISSPGWAMKKHWRGYLNLIAGTLMLALLLGCSPQSSEDKPDLEITNGWARTLATAGGTAAEADQWKTPVGPLGLGPNGLIFMSINNKGGAADKLLKASANVAEKVELHQMVLSGQKTYTYLVNEIELPGHTVTDFKSGSYYIRLVGIKQELRSGAKFILTLEFEKSGKRTVDIVVGNP